MPFISDGATNCVTGVIINGTVETALGLTGP
jgi:hypothetical protein